MPRKKRPESENCRDMMISLTPEVFKRLSEYCEREERPYSWVIRKALVDWLDKHEKNQY